MIDTQKQTVKVIYMSNREIMLKQIEATLKQEKDYLKEFDKKLNDPSVTG